MVVGPFRGILPNFFMRSSGISVYIYIYIYIYIYVYLPL